MTQHSQGSDTSTAISNLLLITGNYTRPGTGAYPLRGHNNVQGASDLGSMPNNLPGYQSVDNPEVRARFESAWRVKLPSTKGLDNHQMVEAIQKGKLKAMYMIGEEMSIVDSNANYVGDAFSKLDFFVPQDIFFSNTCRYPDVILPGAPSLEKEGIFTNAERRIQRLYRVFEPLKGCRGDWKIVQDVANHLGTNWRYQHPSEVMDEIASVTPILAGVNYERLEGYKSLQWPVAADGSDEPLLYTKRFAFPDGKAKLFPPCLDRSHRCTRCSVRLASEQRAAAGTLSRGQPHLSHRRDSPEDSRYLCRSLARTCGGARNSKRHLGATRLPLRSSSRPRSGDRQGTGARTVHADELR